MKKRLCLRVFGYVQGVNYRFYAKEKAYELNLSGFVKNENDGSVSIIAEGDEKKLKEFLSWCKEGPLFARVTNLEEKWEKYQGGFDRFEIRY